MKMKITLQNFEFNPDAFDKGFNKAIVEQFKEALRLYVRAVIVRIPIMTGFLSGAYKPLEDALGISVQRELRTRALPTNTLIARKAKNRKVSLFRRNLVRPGFRSTKTGRIITGKAADKLRRKGANPLTTKVGALGSQFDTFKQRKRLLYYPDRVLKTKTSGRRYVPNKTITQIIKTTKLNRNIGGKSVSAISRLNFNYPINIVYYDINDENAVIKVLSAPWFSRLAGLKEFEAYFRNNAPLAIDKYLTVIEKSVNGELVTERRVGLNVNQ